MTWSPTPNRSRRGASPPYDLTDPSTIAANQRQEITLSQRRALRPWSVIIGSGGLSVLLVLVFLVVFGADPIRRLAGDLDSSNPGAQMVAAGFLAGYAIVLVAAAAMLLRQLRGAWLVRQELAAGHISQVDGQVAWIDRRTDRGYRPEASGYGAPRRLRFPGLGKSPLPPGRFRFYYLPHSGIILSAEPLVDDPDEGPPPLAPLDAARSAPRDLPSILAAVHGHSVEAFERNRLGQLDPSQAGALRRRVAQETLVGAFLFCLPFGLWFLVGGSGLLGLALIGMLSLFGVWFFFAAYRHLAEIRAGRVDILEGVVITEMRRSDKSVGYYYRVGDQRFSVSNKAYDALIDGRSYRVYYMPRSRTLVGIEPL